uniref:Uncharacterized protein AlNc14C53G4090 n=1 Tax=Albugo laibachii Nc14 TaxID=890382 RepID=F0WBP9_9STRA|nr:conserved hypothetical protein [Albugo laibachii Nc14]CCA20533.1 conserved hypothetical protein [Albugo laibachii Nc14]|eukprot:CCA20533.1 conserved hypothetical protein [Albugo laibachii Nc14]
MIDFRESKQPQFLLGFVLFRRRRDQKKSRGYSQRSFVIIANKPYLDLYQRIQHAIGPSFFQYGPRALISAYHEILKWEKPLLNRVALFYLTSTKFSCVIPRICDYQTTGHVEENNHNCSNTSAHILSDDEEGDWVLINSTGEEDTVMCTPENAGMQMEELARIENDFEGTESNLPPADFLVFDKNPCSSSPSLSDLLITRGSHEYTDYEVYCTMGRRNKLRDCIPGHWAVFQLSRLRAAAVASVAIRHNWTEVAHPSSACSEG